MSDFLSSLVTQFGGDAVGSLAQSIGIPKDTAKSLFNSAAPAVMAALAGKAAAPGGATGLMDTFSKLTSSGGDLSSMIGGLLNDPKMAQTGANMTKDLFGDSLGKLTSGLATQTGLQADQVGKAMAVAAPAVMGSVAMEAKAKGMDAAGLTSFLGDEVKSLAADQPDLMKSLGGMMGGDVGKMLGGLTGAAAGVAGAAAGAATGGDEVVSKLATDMGTPALAALGAKVGLPEATVKQLAPVVIGMVLAALSRKAKQPDGIKQIGKLIDDADKAGLTKISAADYVKSADPAKNAEMLGNLIGENSLDNVASNFAGKYGIDPKQAAGLLGVAVPVVLGQLGKMQKNLGTDTAGLAKNISEHAGGLSNTGALDYVLDNTPGISDDISRGIKKLFGG
jgi:hypothetical protein